MNRTLGKNELLLLLPLVTLLALTLLAGTTVQATGLRLIYGNDNLGELDGCG